MQALLTLVVQTADKGFPGVVQKLEEAHEAWRKRKHELAQLVAAKESDPRVVEALKKKYSIEEWYKSITTA